MTYLITHRSYHITDSLDLSVADFTANNGNWNWEKLGQLLTNDCLDIFISIKAQIFVQVLMF